VRRQRENALKLASASIMEYIKVGKDGWSSDQRPLKQRIEQKRSGYRKGVPENPIQ